MRNKLVVLLEIIGLWIVVPIACSFLLFRFDDRVWIAGSLATVVTAVMLFMACAALRPRAATVAVHGLAFFVLTAAIYSYGLSPTDREWTVANVLHPFLPWLAALTVASYVIAAWVARAGPLRRTRIQ